MSIAVERHGIQPLISVMEAARLLGISRAHCYRLIESGDLPAIPVGKKTMRVRPQAIEKFIDQREGASFGTTETSTGVPSRQHGLDPVRDT